MKTRLSIVLFLALALAACSEGSTEWTPLPSGASQPRPALEPMPTT